MSFSQKERVELMRFIHLNKLKIKPSTGWTNYSKFRRNKNALVLDVVDTESLSNVLKFITTLNKKKDPAQRILVRPAAGGREKKYSESYSVHGVEDADIIIRLVGKEFTEIKAVDMNNQVVTIGIHIPGHEAFQKELTELFRAILKAIPHPGKFLPGDYQLDCPNYTDALIRWYKENNLNLEESMLLTAHYCKLLQLSKMMPTPPQFSKTQTTLFQPATNLVELKSRLDDGARYTAAI